MGAIYRFTEMMYEAIIRPIIDTILPPICPVCDNPLRFGQHYFCTRCLGEIGLTRDSQKLDNPLKIRAQEQVEGIVSATSLFYYRAGDGWSRMIHKLKYKDQWRHGIIMGRWLGRELRTTQFACAIDFVIAIPLHPYRMLSRGYNQADYIARGIAEELGVPHIRHGIERTRSNTSQVRLPHHSRFKNVENLFAITDASIFEAKDILLVDDVYTTGSTMLSCAEAILRAAPTCKIHIAPLALAYKHFRD